MNMDLLYESQDALFPMSTTGEVWPDLDGFPILEAEEDLFPIVDNFNEKMAPPDQHKPQWLKLCPAVEEPPSPLGDTWLDTKFDLLDLLEPDLDDQSQVPSEVAVGQDVLATLEAVSNEAVANVTARKEFLSVNNKKSILDMLSEGIEIDPLDVTCEFNSSALSHITTEDVESVLSGPNSPINSGDALQQDEFVGKIISKGSNGRAKPYRKRSTLSAEERKKEKKARKMEQNKVAALRYRQKKKQEQDQVAGELQILQDRNTQLKDRVGSLSKEIQYLKSLMAEVYQAKLKKRK